MEWEAARKAPPEGFPHLPDIQAGRYTSQEYYDLEQQHIWKKSWLFAAHIDEIPEPGCFMKWENTGTPAIIVHGMGWRSAGILQYLPAPWRAGRDRREGQVSAFDVQLSQLDYKTSGELGGCSRKTGLYRPGHVLPKPDSCQMRDIGHLIL